MASRDPRITGCGDAAIALWTTGGGDGGDGDADERPVEM